MPALKPPERPSTGQICNNWNIKMSSAIDTLLWFCNAGNQTRSIFSHDAGKFSTTKPCLQPSGP